MASHRTDPPDVDVYHCPLCGADNHCEVAAGNAVADCWCQKVVITDALLQRLAPPDRGIRCVCRRCVEKQGELISEG